MACKVHPDRESVAICITCKQELCEECQQVGPDGKSYCAAHVPADQPAPQPTAQPTAQPAAQPAPEVEMPPRGDATSVTGAAGESPILAGLCYLCWLLAPLSFVIPIIVLATDYKQSRFMRYHAFNGIFWGVALLVISGALWVALRVMDAIGFPGIILMPIGLLRWAVLVAGMVASILFLVKANNRQDVRIPAISDLADKQAK